MVTRLHRATFTAWKLFDGVSYPLDTGDAQTLSEAVNHAQTLCARKEQLVVLVEAAGGKRVHFYQIKQGKREYRRNPLTGVPGFIAPLYAAPLFNMDLHQFAPVEPWKWSAGADVVGAA